MAEVLTCKLNVAKALTLTLEGRRKLVWDKLLAHNRSFINTSFVVMGCTDFHFSFKNRLNCQENSSSYKHKRAICFCFVLFKLEIYLIIICNVAKIPTKKPSQQFYFITWIALFDSHATADHFSLMQLLEEWPRMRGWKNESEANYQKLFRLHFACDEGHWRICSGEVIWLAMH